MRFLRFQILLATWLISPAFAGEFLAPLELEKGGVQDLGSTGVGDKTTHKVGLKNTGKVGIFIRAETRNPFKVESGCKEELAPGARCELVVLFSPKEQGAIGGQITLALKGDFEERKFVIRIRGTGQRPAFLFLEGDTFVGVTTIGKSQDRLFTFGNNGELPLEFQESLIDPPYQFQGGSFPGTGGTCRGKLEPKKTCTVAVRFTPETTAGNSGRLKISYSNGVEKAESRTVMSAFGLEPATVRLDLPPKGDYGKTLLGGKSDLSFGLVNMGEVLAEKLNVPSFVSPFSFKGGKFPGQGGTCGDSLAPRAKCFVVGQFAPLLAGKANQTLMVKYGDGIKEKEVAGGLNTEGITPARLATRETSPFSFSPLLVTKKQVQVFQITNEGQFDADKLKILTDDFKSVFSLAKTEESDGIPPCGEKLAPSKSCRFTIEFSTKEKKDFDGAVSFSYFNGVEDQKQRLVLKAAGLSQGSVAIENGGKIDFGTVITENTEKRFVTLENKGDVEVTQIHMGTLEPPFRMATDAVKGYHDVCANGILPGRRCMVPLAFKPSQMGPTQKEFIVDYFDGIEKKKVSTSIMGTGVTPAKIELAEGADIDMGIGLITGTVVKVVRVKNSGGVKAEIRDMEVADKPSFLSVKPAEKEPCAAVVAPGASCNLQFTFVPTEKSDYKKKLVINYKDGKTEKVTFKSDVKALGRRPAEIVIDEKPKAFGTILIGNTEDLSFHLKNSGDHPATKLSIPLGKGPFQYKGGKWPGEGGTCSDTVEAQKDCLFVVSFIPTTAEKFAAKWPVSYENGVKPMSFEREIAAEGKAPAKLELTQKNIDFGSILAGSKTTQKWELKNAGQASAKFSLEGLTIAAPFSFQGGKFPGGEGSCGKQVPGGESCQIVFEMAPIKNGEFTTEVSLPYHDGVKDQKATVTFKGSAKLPAQITVAPETAIDFGSLVLGEEKVDKITLTNKGEIDAVLKLESIDSPFSLKSNSCGEKVVAGKNCVLELLYAPKDDGKEKGTLKFTYFDGGKDQKGSLAFAGVALQPAKLELSDDRVKFGELLVGKSGVKELFLKNVGAVTATKINRPELSSPFKYENTASAPGQPENCSTSLSPKVKCVLRVNYTPTEKGSQSGKAKVTYHDGAKEQSVEYEYLGEAEAPPPPPPPPERKIAEEESKESTKDPKEVKDAQGKGEGSQK